MHTEDEKGMIIASLAERLAFTQFFEKRKDFEIIEMSRVIENKQWDVKILSGGTEYLIEVKIRNNTPKDYYENGLLIEQKKHSFLMQHSTEIGYTPLYLNFFSDGAYTWNLNETVIPEWQYGFYPKDNQSGYDDFVEKMLRFKTVWTQFSSEENEYIKTYMQLLCVISRGYFNFVEQKNQNKKILESA